MANEKEKDNPGGTRQGGLLVPLGSGKSVLMPDIYSENNCPAPELTLDDQLPGGDEESGGFNPYDTAVLYKK